MEIASESDDSGAGAQEEGPRKRRKTSGEKHDGSPTGAAKIGKPCTRGATLSEGDSIKYKMSFYPMDPYVPQNCMVKRKKARKQARHVASKAKIRTRLLKVGEKLQNMVAEHQVQMAALLKKQAELIAAMDM